MCSGLWPQMPAVRVKLPESQRVILVVAQDSPRRATVYHAAHQLQGFADFGAPVDVVAQKNDPPAGGVARHAGRVGPVVEVVQQGAQLIGVAVNVADEVVHVRYSEYQFRVSVRKAKLLYSCYFSALYALIKRK